MKNIHLFKIYLVCSLMLALGAAEALAQTLTITYMSNGGEGTMAVQTITGSGTLSPNIFTKHGSVFDDWNTAADGTGEEYLDQQPITVSANSSITLYAQWDPDDEHIRPVYVSSSYSNPNSKEGPAKLCDYDGIRSKWGTSDYVGKYIIMDAGKPIVLHSYDLIAANDTKGYPGRRWKNWTIYGSNSSDADGEWTVVSNVTDGNPSIENYSLKSYYCNENDKAFRYYKLMVSANYGGNMIQMSDIMFKTATGFEFEISTPTDLVNFATLVNNGNIKLHANIKNDIDMSGVAWNSPIGNSLKNHYIGKFDGNGHTISNLSGENTSDRHGLIGVGGDDMKVSNLILKNVNIRGANQVAAVCARIQGGKETIENCAAFNVTLSLNNTTAAAMSAMANSCHKDGSYVTVKSSFTTYDKVASFWQWNNQHQFGGEIVNSYDKTFVDANAASGKLCYDLNGAWKQTLGVDSYPVLGNAKVVKSDGTNYYNEYTASFVPQGGSNCASQAVKRNNTGTLPYGTLPAPTRKGYNFDGWFTSATDGTKITAETAFSGLADVTLYAHWTKANVTVGGASTSTTSGENIIDVEHEHCVSLNLTDATPMLQETVTDFTADVASYIRNMTNQWGTICLPFGFTISGNEATSFYNLTSVSGNELNLSRVTGYVAPGTPLLVSRGKNETSIEIHATNAVASTASVTTGSTIVMKGAFSATTIKGAKYWYISNNAFWPAVKDGADFLVSVAPYRAWFEYNTTETRLRIGQVVDADATAIEAVNAMVNGAEFYDLNGRKLPEAQQGVNIIMTNGKAVKVVIR